MFESAQRLFADLLASGKTDATAIRARPSDTTAVPPSDRLSARQLIDRIAAAERLVHALQAAQRQDIAAFARVSRCRDLSVRAGPPSTTHLHRHQLASSTDSQHGRQQRRDHDE